uniref:Uncharacterized protein n=1 Tax=Arundo donax TaxID=35708 RepID=A0A0A9HQI1_ARUDO
MLLRGLEEG